MLVTSPAASSLRQVGGFLKSGCCPLRTTFMSYLFDIFNRMLDLAKAQNLIEGPDLLKIS